MSDQTANNKNEPGATAAAAEDTTAKKDKKKAKNKSKVPVPGVRYYEDGV
jgi:hypothetical protein